MKECSPRNGHHYHDDPRQKVSINWERSPLENEDIAKLDRIQKSYEELLHDRLIEEITDEVSLDKEIYRIDTLEHFKNALRTKEMFLANPCCWDDAWEDYILRGKAFLRDGTPVDTSSMKDSFFAQCWSLKSDCEGLWKVRYFDPKNVVTSQAACSDNIHERRRLVKIITTVRSLMREVYKLDNVEGHAQFRVGLVHYANANEIKALHNTSFKDPSPTKQVEEVIQSLLTKRLDYEYEKELRLIYHESFLGKGSVPEIRKGIRLQNIDPCHFLKGVEIDPWCPDDEFEAIKSELENQHNVFGVAKSSLFADEHIPTVVFGDDCLVMTPSRIIPPKV